MSNQLSDTWEWLLREMSLALDVSSLIHPCFHQLRNISKLCPIISKSEMSTFIHASVESPWIVYILHKTPARVLTRSFKCAHVSHHTSADLVSLSIRICGFHLYGSVWWRTHIRELLQPHVTCGTLGSSDRGLLSELKTKGDGVFALVNSLPSCPHSKKPPKAHVLKLAFRSHFILLSVFFSVGFIWCDHPVSCMLKGTVNKYVYLLTLSTFYQFLTELIHLLTSALFVALYNLFFRAVTTLNWKYCNKLNSQMRTLWVGWMCWTFTAC